MSEAAAAGHAYERAPVSETTRALLCYFAAADPRRPVPRVDADWPEVFLGLYRNGLISLAHRCLSENADQDYPPSAFRGWVRQAYVVSAVNVALMYRKAGKLLRAFAARGLDHMVVKGPAVAMTVYPDPALRAFSDLDVVVRERDWRRTHELLLELGFQADLDLPDPPPRVVAAAVPYELRYWNPTENLVVEVHYDDLLNAGLASRDVEGFWARSRFVDVQGVPVRVLSLEDTLIHLCAHAHYHGYTRLNWLSDIALLLREHAGGLDWARLIATVRREEAQVAVYYSLHVAERLLGVGPPPDVLAQLRPDRVRRWLHERYMPERKIMSLEPMPRADFSFYFIPLYKQMLPDLLVMGRRREKLAYLLRLLCPPADWLRFYYDLAEDEGVALHYALHPMKLGWHYAAATVSAIGRLFQSRASTTGAVPIAWWSEESPANRMRSLAGGVSAS